MGHDHLLDDYIAYQIVMGDDTDKKRGGGGGGGGGCLGCVLLALAIPAGLLAALSALL